MPASGIWYESLCIPKATNGDDVSCGIFTISFPRDAYTITVSSDGEHSYASQYYENIQYVVAIDKVVYRNSSDYIYGKYPHSVDDDDSVSSVNNQVEFYTGRCNSTTLCNGEDNFSLFELQLTLGMTLLDDSGWYIASDDAPYDFITSDWADKGVVKNVQYYHYTCLNDTNMYFLVLGAHKLGLDLYRRDNNIGNDYGTFHVTYAGKDRGQGKPCTSYRRCSWEDIIVELYDSTDKKNGRSSGNIILIVVGTLLFVSMVAFVAIQSAKGKTMKKEVRQTTTNNPARRNDQEVIAVAVAVAAPSTSAEPTYTLTRDGNLIAIPVPVQVPSTYDTTTVAANPVANAQTRATPTISEQFNSGEDYC